ncbi:MAG: hypothetical protein ABSG81_04970 [Acidimicrobiales bacterium]
MTRGEAELHPPSINRFEALGESGLAGRVEGSGAAAIGSVEAEENARLESYEDTRRCPSCGVDDFTERAVTKAHPADEPARVVETGGPPLGRLSGDRKTFWDGTAWISTVSDDGTLRWNGTHWAPN